MKYVMIQLEDDTLFKKNMINYRAHLLNSGYEARHIDRSFIKVAKMKRNTNLWPKRAVCNQGAKSLNFGHWTPAFRILRT